MRAFTYDLDNRLLTGSAPTPVSLTYDPLGRLQTTTAASVTTNFLYDGSMLVAEYDNSGNILRRYVPGPGVDEPLVLYPGTGTTGRRWLHADDQGSIIAWSDSTANPQATYGYGPSGEPSAWTGVRYRYTGQLMIPEALLYNYKARVYDPGLGRFLQTDPVGYASDINAYSYTRSDPINGKDELGLATIYSGACGGPYGGWTYRAAWDGCVDLEFAQGGPPQPPLGLQSPILMLLGVKREYKREYGERIWRENIEYGDRSNIHRFH